MAFSRMENDGEHDSIVAEINVTPLADIFLVLLIIFMVTSTALTHQSSPVDLPRAGSGVPQPAGLVVTVTADDRIEVDGAPVPLAELTAVLRARLEADGERSVILQGDRSVVLERAIEVMSAAREAGAERIAIATEPKALPSR